ncbi:sulfatase [Candidatus Poribacteria bacterium]|nr:sulfatase [Candidatus Poribacteria bacterium]
MPPQNLIFILSDQHNRNITGVYGDPIIQTPNLDRLAERGTTFSNAYTNCPICVPARASLATGRYVHQIRYWDNAFPYDGRIESWGHRLKQQNYQVDSIGKLHFRGSHDDNGFCQEIDPLYVVDGRGDVLSCIRNNPPTRDFRQGINNAGAGNSTYLQYDANNADQACQWLTQHKNDQHPWVLFLSFVCPHPPYISPPEFYQLYPKDQIPLPAQWHTDEWPNHPAIERFRDFFAYSGICDEEKLRNFLAAYYGLCTYLDQQIGRVLQTMEEHDLLNNSRIIYTSDHGESLGTRGLFGKFTMYEESAAVPFIIAGADVPKNKVVETPISLIDCFPSIIEAVGGRLIEEDENLPGKSIWETAQTSNQNGLAFSEYHAVGSKNAIYMLRNRQHKYIYYVDEPVQLFDLQTDPEETQDLSKLPEYQETLQTFEKELKKIVDPKGIDTIAKADQKSKIRENGGETAIRQRGAFDNSPVPGENPIFRQH